jgi:hypothetical protein
MLSCGAEKHRTIGAENTVVKIEFKRSGGFAPITNASGFVDLKDDSGQVVSPSGEYHRSLTADEAAQLRSIAAPENLKAASGSPVSGEARDAFQYQITVTTKDGKQLTFNTAELDKLSPQGHKLLSWVQNELQKILAHKAAGH